jgi:hypothetical protein
MPYTNGKKEKQVTKLQNIKINKLFPRVVFQSQLRPWLPATLFQ